MAILLNDNLNIAANKPVDSRYGPYVDVAAALAAIPTFQRHIGLTVGIGTTNTTDYWFKSGTTNSDLIEKVPTVNVPVTSVAGKTGAVTLVKGDVGLGNVDNTSDADKPISTATQTALDTKQATLVSGTTIKTINNESILGAGNITVSATGTQVNADWNETDSSSSAFILNKPLVFPPETHSHELNALLATGAGEGDLLVALGDGTVGWQNGTTWAGMNITAADIGAASSTHTHPLTALTQSGATTGQVIKWTGSVWAPADDSGGTGITNLSYTASATGGTVLSDTGSDASLPLVDTTNAGLMSPADKTKLNDIAANANNYTHPNHTGDVTSTGDGATVIANNAVNNAKLAQIAANTIKGRATTGTGNVEDLTAAQVRTILNVADGATANVASTVNPQPLGTAAVGTATAYARADHVHELPTASTIGAQPTLVSGTNIKTINGTSLLGGGDISIGSGGTQVNADWNATSGVEQILNKPTEFNPSSHTHSQDQISSDYYGNGSLYADIEYIDGELAGIQTAINDNRLVTPAIISSSANLFSGRWVHQRVQNLSASSITITLPTSPIAGDRFIISSTGGVTQVTQPIIIRRRNWTTTGTGDQFTTLATITALNQEYQFTTQASAQQGWYLEIVETHSHALEDLQQSGATTGQVIKWNGTSWAPAADAGGGGGASFLNYTASPTGGSLTVDSLNVSLDLSTTTNAGLMSPADKTKLDGLNGPYATLENGKVPESQLPSYVDDVLEFATQGTRPNPGETGKIYVTLDDNKCWRWTGTTYIEISPSSGQISAIAGLQEALNGKQSTIFNQATIQVTTNNQTLLVSSYYPNNNGADLRRTLSTITFSAGVTSGTTIIRLPQWLATGLGAWRGDQAFFKFQVPAGVTLQFQWHDGTNWVNLIKFNHAGSQYSAAFQATLETTTHVVWEVFSNLYGARDLFSPRLGSVFLDAEVQSHTLEPNNIYSISPFTQTIYGMNLPAPSRIGDKIIVTVSGTGTSSFNFTQDSLPFTSYSGIRTGGNGSPSAIEFLSTLVGGGLQWVDITPNGSVNSVAGKTGTVTLNVGDLSQSGATTGQVIKWTGSVWAPADDGGGTSSTGEFSSITATGTPQEGSQYNEKTPGVISGNKLTLTSYTAIGPADGPPGEIELVGSNEIKTVITTENFNSNGTNSTYLFKQNGGGTVARIADIFLRAELPEPKIGIRLADGAADVVFSLDLETRTPGPPIPLSRIPFVVVQDISEERLADQNIFLECVILNKRKNIGGLGKRLYSVAAPSPWYVHELVPGEWEQNWIHPWPQNFMTRAGKHFSVWEQLSGMILMNRPNHFPITGLGQKISLSNFLNGRFASRAVRYRAPGENFEEISLFTPLNLGRRSTVGSRLPYSSVFSPLRIACRYIIWDSAANEGRGQFIVGPLSKTVKIWYSPFPFNTDHLQSSVVGKPVATINQKHLDSPKMDVWIE